jgi:hypothetical protein
VNLQSSGEEVLAKMYKGEPTAKTYANRTQAHAAATAMGEGWAVIQRGRPWYVKRIQTKTNLRTRRNSYTFQNIYGDPITLTDEQEAVLRAFAQKHGRTWKSHLLSLWETGRDTGVLRQIRNMVGPSSLKKIRFNKGRRTNRRGR